MFQLTKLRKELQFNEEIGGIVNVLKGVAAAEFYRLQKARKRLDEFGNYLEGFLQIADTAGSKHLFLETSNLPPARLLITSDIGFLGKLNVAVVNVALEQYSGEEKLIVVGKQGLRYVEEGGRGFVSFPGITDEVTYTEIEKLGSYIISHFLDKKIGRTVVIYPHFISFGVWQVQTRQLLPCRFLFLEDRKGKEREIIVEPSSARVIEDLVKVWIKHVLHGIFWESKLSEWSARVMHLEGSSDEIKQQDKKMRFQYFRLLHEISDKNIREIFSSKLAVGRVK